MKIRLAVMIAVALFGTAVLASAQSLGELAKKEKERREKVGTAPKAITNDDTPKYANGAVTTVTLPAPPPSVKPGEKATGEKTGTETATPPGAPKPDSNEPADLQGRTESFWRQTMADARQKVKDLENESNALIIKRNELQNRFYTTDDGFKRQAVFAELQKVATEQDQNKEKLEKTRAMLEDLEKEGRKNGALPGWLDGKSAP